MQNSSNIEAVPATETVKHVASRRFVFLHLQVLFICETRSLPNNSLSASLRGLCNQGSEQAKIQLPSLSHAPQRYDEIKVSSPVYFVQCFLGPVLNLILKYIYSTLHRRQ